MRNKSTVTTKLDKLSLLLLNLDRSLAQGTSLYEAREKIAAIKDEIEALQTLINSESDSWN